MLFVEMISKSAPPVAMLMSPLLAPLLLSTRARSNSLAPMLGVSITATVSADMRCAIYIACTPRMYKRVTPPIPYKGCSRGPILGT